MIEQKKPFLQNCLRMNSFITNLLKVTIPVCLLAACSSNHSDNHTPITTPIQNLQLAPKKQIGLLLPLTGRNGNLGNNMLKAAQLAIHEPNALDIHDTAQIGGASAAAHKAIEAGDGIILGPLTAKDTTEVASVTNIANIPVLSYSSNASIASSNVWIFGITQNQQIETMVKAAKSEGRTKFAAFLPDNSFGRAMADGLMKSCSDLGLMQPIIVYHSDSSSNITQKLKILSNFDERMELAKNNPQNQSKTTDSSGTDKLQENGDSLQNELIPSKSTRSDGFNGIDGFFALQPDGSVKRDLQIFEIQSTGGGKMISTTSSVTPRFSNKVN